MRKTYVVDFYSALELVRERKLPYCYTIEYGDGSFYVGSTRIGDNSRIRYARRRSSHPIKDVTLHFFNEAGEVRDQEKHLIKELQRRGVTLLNKVLYNYRVEPDTAKTYSLRYSAENIAARAKIRESRG